MPPAIFVLYGATGDLAARMVLPAFYTLAAEGLVPAQWWLIGSGRGAVTQESFAGHVRQSVEASGVEPDRAAWSTFEEHLRYAGGDVAHGDHAALSAAIDDARRELGPDAQVVHYLAVPPDAFPDLTTSLGSSGLATGSRVVYEKPFGTSMSSFRSLDALVNGVFDEAQVYRIDHFLAKEATQDLHVLRFANGIFGRMWDRHSVRAVQIDCPETLGVLDRSDFYDHTGAILDMLVTHLFQVAAEVAMEPPASLEAADLQAARESVIGRFRAIDPADVVIGQFDGYRDIVGLSRSRTETFVAARLWVDTPRWRDVPFLLRTGKRMHQTHQTVSLILAEPLGPFGVLPMTGNVLQFALDGSGAIDLRLMAKQPGVGLALGVVGTRIAVRDVGDGLPLPPYVRLLSDVLRGDRSLVTRPDGLEHVWEVAAPMLDIRRKPLPYAPGSWGPGAASRLAAPDGWLLGQ